MAQDTACYRANILESLAEELREHAIAACSNIVDDVIPQRDGLKNAGGYRDDHAAKLLELVRDDLHGFSEWILDVLAELDEAIENPFGDEQ